MISATTGQPSTSPAVEPVAGAFKAAGDLAGDMGRLGAAWFELARAEMAVARLSAARLALGVVLGGVLAFSVWLFACLALGYWLAGIFQRSDLAFAAVAAVNGGLMAVLVMQMRRWWRAMQMPGSRAALGEIARTLS